MAISIPDRAWITSQTIQDTEKRLRFLEAVIMYKIDGTMPSDDDIAPLLVAALWNAERNKKISETMKWNKNAKKRKTDETDKNRWKQIETDWNSSEQIETDAKQIVLYPSSELVETVKTDENSSDSSVLYINNNINNKNITKDINILIQELKQQSNKLWIVYDKKNERNFCKHILTAKDFWEFADSINQTRTEFALNIMKASVIINYWKWPCSWPMMIYQNYAEVYNKTKQQVEKKQKSTIQSF